MPVGPELDALIAKMVMDEVPVPVPEWSSDNALCWDVIKAVLDKYRGLQFRAEHVSTGWYAKFTRCTTGFTYGAFSEKQAHAVGIAALLVYGVEEVPA